MPLSGLLDDSGFRAAAEIDDTVPREFGLYALRLVAEATLPDPFGSILSSRSSRLVYIGEARTQTLHRRLLGNELRARGNGTFFRSIGAVLGYLPPAGSLAGHARQQNYRFAPNDRDAIIGWINQHLEVNWIVMPQAEVHAAEVGLIREHTPLLNLKDNPLALAELKLLRELCRSVAATA